MYQVRAAGYRKDDPVLRWALPDRVFFACGACHILADAFLRRHQPAGAAPVWIKPSDGHAGHHIVVAGEGWIFDYHGYAAPERYFAHTVRTARRRWPGWDAELVPLPRSVLSSEQASRTFPGLWLREAGQFLHDAMPRAERFLDRFPPPPEARVGL